MFPLSPECVYGVVLFFPDIHYYSCLIFIHFFLQGKQGLPGLPGLPGLKVSCFLRPRQICVVCSWSVCNGCMYFFMITGRSRNGWTARSEWHSGCKR